MMRKAHNTVGETFWTLALPNEAGPGVEMGIRATVHGLHVGHEVLTWDEIDEARKALIDAALDTSEKRDDEQG